MAQLRQSRGMIERDGEQARRNLESIRRNAGEDLLRAVQEPGTIEVMLNPDGRLWHEKLGEDIKPVLGRDGMPVRMNPGHALGMIQVIATFLNKSITAESPILDNAEFPLDGSRFSAAIPPVVASPVFCIRKKPDRIYTLDDYVRDKIMSEKHKAVICEAVRAKKNIVVIGSTSSGKTTLTNAIINEIVRQDRLERVFIFEDTAEIQCDAPNALFFHTSLTVGLSHLLKLALRMRPDRICVGEVRDHAALELMDAWNTGHPGGVATVHADDARRGLSRLSSMISRHPNKPSVIEEIVGDAVNVIIFIRKTPDHGRRIEEIIEVEGWIKSRNDYEYRHLAG